MLSDEHKLNKKLDFIASMIDKLDREDPDAMSPQQIQCLADKLDKEKTEFEICSDNTCRKKKDGKILWTDHSGAW